MRLNKKAEAIFRQLTTNVDEYKKLENEPYLPLSIDRLSETRFALAHNYIQNGDVVPQVDVEFEVGEHVTPMTYQDPMGYQSESSKGLTEFCELWMKNLEHQGFLDL